MTDHNIKGIVYKARGENIFTGIAEEISDISSLPWADYEGFGFENYLSELLNLKASSIFSTLYFFTDIDNRKDIRPIHVITSRSCPFSCTFCFHPIGKKYRQRSLDDFFAEIEMLISKYGINLVNILDELFEVDKKRLFEFCNRIKKYNLRWIVQMRGDIGFDEEIAKKMRDSGCIFCSFGMESASDIVLKSMKKEVKFWQIEKSLKTARKAGLATGGNFIFGDVSENMDTVNTSLEWFKANPDIHMDLLYIISFPGSEIYNQALKKEKIIDEVEFLEEGCPVVNVSNLSDEEYKRLAVIFELYREKYIMFAELIACEKIEDDNIDDLYSISIKCPVCNGESIYHKVKIPENEKYSMDRIRVFCKNCRHCLAINFPKFTERMSDIIEELINITDNKNLAIFGAGSITMKLLSKNINRGRLQPMCIFDNSAIKQGLDIEGVPILPFSNESIINLNIGNILNTIYDYKDAVIKQINDEVVEKAAIKIFSLEKSMLFSYIDVCNK